MRILTLLAVLLLSTTAFADTFTADFEDGLNAGNWTFSGGGWLDTLYPTGGNPGGWYGVNGIDTFAPILSSEYGAEVFAGNYVAMQVSRISGDFKTDASNNEFANYYNFTVLLRNNNNTPNDIEDDLYVYPDPFANVIPQVGQGWTHYDFDIPSDFVGAPGELPAGWVGGSYFSGPDWFPEDRTYQEVLANVTSVEFWWIHPAFFAILSIWDAGADNITIEYADGAVGTEEASWGGVKALFR